MFYELNYSKICFWFRVKCFKKGIKKSEFCLKQGRKISDFCLKQGQGMRGRAARIYRVPTLPPPVCVTILTCVLLALVSVRLLYIMLLLPY